MPQHASPESGSKPRPAKTKPKVLEEMVQTSFRLPLTRWRKLQTLCINERASAQSIIIGALEAEFAKRGLDF